MKHLLTGLLLISLRSYSQEVNSEFAFHGFSDDLKYAVVETWYEGAMEDEPGYVKFIFVDVEKNSYAVSPVNYTGKTGMTMDIIRKNARKNAQPYFTKFKISGNKKGTSLPLESADNAIKDVQVYTINGAKHLLNLGAVPTGNKIIEMYDEYKLDLTITHHGKVQILQRDKTLPKSRSNAMGYELKGVYYENGSLAVVVVYKIGPGFEGYPDRYNMLVTGVLK